jgi:hypothetical protein
MLLSNLTASSAACAALLSLQIDIITEPTFPNSYYPPQSRCGTSVAPTPYPAGEAQAVLALPLLLDAFVQGAVADESADSATRIRKGSGHFLSSVFANLSTVSVTIVSPTFLTLSYYVVSGWTKFLPHTSATKCTRTRRTAGVPAGEAHPFHRTQGHHPQRRRRFDIKVPEPSYPLILFISIPFRNCAFHAPGHQALLCQDSANVSVPPSVTVAPGIDALPYLLLPLAGPEEFDLEVR